MNKIFIFIIFNMIIINFNTNLAFSIVNTDINILEQSAINGDQESQLELGNMYFEKKLYDKAKLWYEEAAKNGNSVAQNKMGNMYHEGLGVQKDLFKAKYFYEQSAINGNKYAQFNLGNSYYHGEGCKIDLNEAFKWLDMSCKAGYKKACETYQYISAKSKKSNKKSNNYKASNDSNNYVQCSYNKDDSLGVVLDAASEVLGFFTGFKAGVAELAAGALSGSESHDFLCKFSPDVKKYSVAYFYSGTLLNERFRKKETHTLSDNDYKNGVKFSTTTAKSILDFITIRVDAVVNGETVKTLYAYEIDSENNKINPIDTNLFLENIVDQYEMR